MKLWSILPVKKTFPPNVQQKKIDPEAVRLLVDAKGVDPMPSLQETANSAITIFDADPIGLINVLCLMVTTTLEKMAKVHTNKAQIKYIGERIQVLHPTLAQLKNDQRGCRFLKRPLISFKDCMDECHAQVCKYSEKKWFKKILTSGADQEKFQQLAIRLNDNIGQLNLTLNVEQAMVVDQMQKRQLQDKADIMANMARIIQLEEESIREVNALRQERQRCSISQKEFNTILGQQLEAIPLEMARKFELNATEQQAFFEAQFNLLNKRFVELNASSKPKTKPPIPRDLSIPFYDLVFDDVIKKGSIGVIYRGEWCGVPAAIKIVGNRIQGDDYKYFLNELNNMARLHHPNIVQVYGACLEPEACIVMEYVSQGSLMQLLKDKPLDLSACAQIAKDLGNALRYLHNVGGIHRDLNPDNVLIDELGSAKLSDFGLAKSMSKNVSTVINIHDNNRRSSGQHSYLEWMAPELNERAVKPSPMTDIYNLGLTLYYLFARESLFVNVPRDQLMLAVKEGLCRENIVEKIPAEYQDLIKSCLHLNAALRPDALEVSNQLTAIHSKIKISPKAVPRQSALGQFSALSPDVVHATGGVYARDGNHEQAYQCYLHAANAGCMRAETDLGMALLNGAGCQQDKPEAFTRLLSAAKKDHLRAQFNVAAMLEFGDGIPKDTAQALYWYEQAAAQKNDKAAAKVLELKSQLSSSASQKEFNKTF